MRFFDKNRGFVYKRIVLFHLVISFLFLIAGLLVDFFDGNSPVGFLLIIIVSIINFPGVKTVGILFGDLSVFAGDLSAFTLYALGIFVTNFYLWLLFYLICHLGLLVKKKN